MLRERAKTLIKRAIVSLAVIMAFFIAADSLAQNLGINALTEGGAALGRADLRVIVARIIQVFLGLLGTIAVVLIIYGGFIWMTAAGDAQKIGKARKILINAVIGLLIILSSLAITQFIVSRLLGATGILGPEGGAFAWSQPLSGSLGGGIISYHLPERGASAPRNTKIAITFKEPIGEKSLVVDSNKDGVYGNDNDEANKVVFKLVKTGVLKKANNNFKNVAESELVTADAKFTPDKLNFVFTPAALLGSPTETISYTAYLSPELKRDDGAPAFSQSFGGGYSWEFQVEPVIDNVPPKILSIIPSRGMNPRNTVLQMNFSEGLDPTSGSGRTGEGFGNIALKAGDKLLDGSYKISNGYKTVEFLTNDLCGTNSCGGAVFCLPGNSLISGLIRAATLGDEPPQSRGFPYDGIVDLVGNSLDGNGDGKTWGPTAESGKKPYAWVGGDAAKEGDDVSWQFNTSNLIDLVPPKMTKTEPGPNSQNVGLETPIEMTFSKLMTSFTLNNSNLAITFDPIKNYELWYTILAQTLDPLDNPAPPAEPPAKTKAIIRHGPFVPSVAGGAQYNFYPSVNSKVQDLWQNCYNPSAGPACAPTDDKPYCCNGALSAVKCPYVP